MSNMAQHHKAMADAIELEIEAKGVEIHALKRQRDAHRAMQEFFTPPPNPLGSPLPVIAPPTGFDPDYDDNAPGQEPEPDEAAP